MSNISIIKKLDLLDKTQLMKLAKKLQITGISRMRKDEIKQTIILYLKNNNKKQIQNVKLNPVVNRIQNKCKVNNPNTTITSFTNGVVVSYIPKVEKIVAIGDLHGDLVATIKSLKLAGVIDKNIPNDTQDINNINWIGGKTVVVQLGDQIDRVRPAKLFNGMCKDTDPEINQDEGSDLKIIFLFNKLQKQAAKCGGACISIIGNHELMNVDGDFRYVSPREFREFGNFFKARKSLINNNVPFGYKQRKEAFAPGGPVAKNLGQLRYSIFQVGSWIFVHGGISPNTASKYTINEINTSIKKWLYGNMDKNISDAIDDLYHNDDDEDSPFWCRLYSDLEDYDIEIEKQFIKTIDILNKKNNRNNNNKIRGMVCGHSPQYMYDKGINSACNNSLWRVDVGMSRAFGLIDEKNNPECINRKVQVLVIENDNKFSIIKEK